MNRLPLDPVAWCLIGFLLLASGLRADDPKFILDLTGTFSPEEQEALDQVARSVIVDGKRIPILCILTEGNATNDERFLDWFQNLQRRGEINSSRILITYDAQTGGTSIRFGTAYTGEDEERLKAGVEQILGILVDPNIEEKRVKEGIQEGLFAVARLARGEAPVPPEAIRRLDIAQPDQPSETPTDPGKATGDVTKGGEPPPPSEMAKGAGAADPDAIDDEDAEEARSAALAWRVKQQQRLRLVLIGGGSVLALLCAIAFVLSRKPASQHQPKRPREDGEDGHEPVSEEHGQLRKIIESPLGREALDRMWLEPMMRRLASELMFSSQLSPLLSSAIETMDNPARVAEAVEILSRDKQLTSELLKLINSGWFGLPQYVTELKYATALMSREQLIGLVYLIHVLNHFQPKILFENFKPEDLCGFQPESVTSMSMVVADYARIIASDVHAKPPARLVPDPSGKRPVLSEDLVYHAVLAGMLHQVGRVVLAWKDPVKFRQALSLTRRENLTVNKAVERVFTVPPTVVSAYLLAIWGLPEPAIEGVLFYVDPLKQGRDDLGVADTVHLANLFACENYPDIKVGPSDELNESLPAVRNIANRIDPWRDMCLTRADELVAGHSIELSENDRKLIRNWSREFESNWDESRLANRVLGLPPMGTPLRYPALVEFIKIDLRKNWEVGQPVHLESYMTKYPELGTPESLPAELIYTEYQSLLSFGDPVPLSSYEAKYPAQAARLREIDEEGGLAPESTDSSSAGVKISMQPANPAAARPAPRRLPEHFGRYHIQQLLGEGGMGAVYLAWDKQLERQIALKVPFFSTLDGPEVLKRFEREAKAAAKFDHPNVCRVYDVGKIDGISYLTMAYIEGHSLADHCKPESFLPAEEVAQMVRKLALVLDECHQQEIVHRDLKPSNVMINKRGEPVIMDFGLARKMDTSEQRLTQANTPLGTPAYMAPELVRGELDAGSSADIYSLGVVFFELLTGKLPFSEEGSVSAMFIQIVSEDPTPLSTYRPDLPLAYEHICNKAMAKDPADRFQSMQEFADAIDNAHTVSSSA